MNNNSLYGTVYYKTIVLGAGLHRSKDQQLRILLLQGRIVGLLSHTY